MMILLSERNLNPQNYRIWLNTLAANGDLIYNFSNIRSMIVVRIYILIIYASGYETKQARSTYRPNFINQFLVVSVILTPTPAIEYCKKFKSKNKDN